MLREVFLRSLPRPHLCCPVVYRDPACLVAEPVSLANVSFIFPLFNQLPFIEFKMPQRKMNQSFTSPRSIQKQWKKVNQIKTEELSKPEY